MYIVRTYTLLMYIKPADSINAVMASVPFNNQYGKRGIITWSIKNLLYNYNYLKKYQLNTTYYSPPDTDPHNHKYTYMPIGASIHDARYIQDFENSVSRNTICR